MCFSAEASFTVGAALIPAGVYCVWQSVIKKPSYLGFAAVPIFFGIQQIGEGFVWLALKAHDAQQTRTASLFFLFFALAFWPFWFPVLTTIMEPEPRRKVVLACLSVLAVGWFWILYYPLLVDPSLLSTTDEHHSIQYVYDGLAIYDYAPKPVLRVLYVSCVALPMVLGSQNWGRIPGLVLGASAVFTAIVYSYAFVSVWCFFAAIMAAYCCWVFYHLPLPAGTPPAGSG